MEALQKMVKSQALTRQDKNYPPDIIRLLDLLARIEIRRQTKQRSTDKAL